MVEHIENLIGMKRDGGSFFLKYDQLPIGSMYAIYGNIYHQYTPNVSIYTIHGSYGLMTTVDSGVWIPRLIASLQLASICHSRAKLTSTFVWIEVETCVNFNIRIWWIRRANLGEIRQDGCTPVEGLLDQLVRAFVVQVVSSFFGSLPFAALVIFFTSWKLHLYGFDVPFSGPFCVAMCFFASWWCAFSLLQ